LSTIAWAVGIATVVQADHDVWPVADSRGPAAQRAITDMRRRGSKSTSCVCRAATSTRPRRACCCAVMNDARGIRNLVGTGLVQLTGSIVTAIFALGFLAY
jgi:subfamily B ATP-binding cassette protein MsbA